MNRTRFWREHYSYLNDRLNRGEAAAVETIPCISNNQEYFDLAKLNLLAPGATRKATGPEKTDGSARFSWGSELRKQ